MPKITHRCPRCDLRGLDPVYRRFSLPKKGCKWIRLECVFYCQNCDALVLFPFQSSEWGKLFDEPVVFPEK